MKGKKPVWNAFIATERIDSKMAISAKKVEHVVGISGITAGNRAKQYPKVFYEDGGISFCRFCKTAWTTTDWI